MITVVESAQSVQLYQICDRLYFGEQKNVSRHQQVRKTGCLIGEYIDLIALKFQRMWKLTKGSRGLVLYLNFYSIPVRTIWI